MKSEFDFFKTICLFLIAINLVVWYLIFFPNSLFNSELYFLKVGQGDSSLALLPGRGDNCVKFLIDGGPINGGLNINLEKVLGADRYIDLIFVSHPQLDHFGGLIEVLKIYKVGAVLYNGEDGDDKNWTEFNRALSLKNISKIALSKGDGVVYGASSAKVINSADFSANTNDSSLVLVLETDGFKALFTGDIGAATERILAKSEDIGADILKVSHHGSKYSSDPIFLKQVNPKISVIEVGKNSYGHPAKEVLERLSAGSKIFNTYEEGIIKILIEAGKLKVYGIEI